MPDRIEELEREVERLRDLLWENDIDPEPYKEQFGPPTAAMANLGAIVKTTLAARGPQLTASIVRHSPLLSHMSGDQWRNVYNVK